MKAIATEATERSILAEDALRLVIDTTPALIHTGRPDGYLDYFNQRWLEFLGLPLEEVCGWRWTGAVHPEDVAGLRQKWHAALGSGEPLEAEARVQRADGEYRLLLHRKVPLRNERGAILKWYGSSIDIEEQRRAQEGILQDEKERLSEALLAEAQRLTRIGTFVQRLTRIIHVVDSMFNQHAKWLEVSNEVVDLFKLVRHTEHPHGMTDREFEALFTPDKPVIFNFQPYAGLIHRLTYRRPGQHHIHVRGYKEKGNIDTPLELAIRNQTDRFSLAIDAIDRMPRFSVRGSSVREALLNEQIACKNHACECGIDREDITNWKWPYEARHSHLASQD
jgi:PAS domain S-box-containing protein